MSISDPGVTMRPLPGCMMLFATMRRVVTSAAFRQRHVSVRFFRVSRTESGAKRRATRLGGIPAGSLEVTWEARRLVG